MKRLKAMVENQERKLLDESVETLLREVKEYASRTSEMNVDTLHQKLIVLDEKARKAHSSNSEEYNFVLQRFLANKFNPNVGSLVVMMLSSKTEYRLMEKEQKFHKSWDMQPLSQSNQSFRKRDGNFQGVKRATIICYRCNEPGHTAAKCNAVVPKAN